MCRSHIAFWLALKLVNSSQACVCLITTHNSRSATPKSVCQLPYLHFTHWPQTVTAQIPNVLHLRAAMLSLSVSQLVSGHRDAQQRPVLAQGRRRHDLVHGSPGMVLLLHCDRLCLCSWTAHYKEPAFSCHLKIIPPSQAVVHCWGVPNKHNRKKLCCFGLYYVYDTYIMCQAAWSFTRLVRTVMCCPALISRWWCCWDL